MRPSFLLLVLALTSCATRLSNPSPGVFRTKAESRQLSCTRLSQVEAHRRYPGEIDEPAARELATGTTDALVCESRVLQVGERPARDEAILATLGASTSAITEQASATVPGAVTFHVDALYPDLRVASKIAVAARTSLVERGRAVSDRVPVLAAGDVEVLSHLPIPEAMTLACSRYFAEQALGQDEVLLAFSILDARETTLHGGLCRQGKWTWLQ